MEPQNAVVGRKRTSVSIDDNVGSAPVPDIRGESYAEPIRSKRTLAGRDRNGASREFRRRLICNILEAEFLSIFD
jgi:hypothetical protein